MKKLLYIGHQYHLKTKSNRFLLELLQSEYEITFISFDPYTKRYEGMEEAKDQYYDVLLLWQIMPDPAFLRATFGFKKGVLFPMYDYIASLQDDPWPDFRQFTIINFCRTLHESLKARGFDSHYIQYFPKPADKLLLGDENSVFLWQRMECINANTVQTLFADHKPVHLHIHKALDPNQKFTEPGPAWEGRVSYSEWFNDPSEMHTLMQQSAFYIAPRPFEGIGMSFLEAMALGRCVIAPDHPTMNEYIVPGQTGYLFSMKEVKPLTLENVQQIQKNTYAYIQQGYTQWLQERHKILEWMAAVPETPTVTIVTAVYNAVKGGREDTLIQCIESVHSQRYPHVEHLVVDGASRDGTLTILDRYRDLGWIHYISEPDHGMYEAMNKGIRMAQGKYVAFLNSDDYYHNPEAIGESVFALENSGADFSFASDRVMDEDGVCRTLRKPEVGSFIAQMPFCHQTMFTRKAALEACGGFDESYQSSADYDLVLRLLLAGNTYVCVEDDIVTYRRGGVSESMQQRADQEKFQIFQRLYAPYYPEADETFARELAGRHCPAALLEAVCAAVPAPLAQAVRQSATANAARPGYYTMPQEWVVPMEHAVKDSVASSGNSERVGQLLETIHKKDVRLNKFVQYFGLLDRWLWLKLQNKNIKVFFEQNHYRRIAIYGIGEVGNRLYEELCRTSDIQIAYAIDAAPGKGHSQLRVYTPEEPLPPVDAVIVSVDFLFPEIKPMLEEKVSCPVLSIDDVIFNIS